METVLAAAVYLLLGVALATAALWYVNAVRERFFSADPTPALGKVLVVAADDATSKSYAAALPAMVIGATGQLKGQANIAIRALNEARTELAGTVRPVEDVDLPVPGEFRQEIAINLKVADVEVGSLLSFLLERARDRNLISLTVALGADRKDGEVYGHLPGQGGYSFAAKSAGDLPSIARAVAVQLVHRAAQRGEAAFEALDPEAFAKTVAALGRYARLATSQRRMLAAPGQLRAEYAAVLAEVKETAALYPGWQGLQWLAAQSAKEAGDWENAVAFYQNLVDLAGKAQIQATTPEQLAENKAIRGRAEKALMDAELKLEESSVASLARARGGPPADPAAAAAVLPTIPPTQSVLTAIGLDRPGSAARVTIGLVGPGPSPDLVAGASASVEIIGGAAADVADEALRDYQTTMWQTTRLVAPDTRFVFSPFRGGSTATSTWELVRAVEQLLASKPDIILMGWGGNEPSAAVDRVVREAAEAALVVLPAGNEAGPSAYRDVTDVTVVTAAVTAAGAPAPFSSTAAGAAWAPGADIPVVSAATGAIQRRSGTSYAAAIAAGAAALLKAAHPRATPAQLRDALIATAKPAEGRAGPAIINVPAALARLGAAPAG